MAYNWCEYLTFAKCLRDDPTSLKSTCHDETIKRNIISRAYYAAFHHSKQYAELLAGIKFPRDHVHSEVQNWYQTNKEKEVLDGLRELSLWRTQCDYDDEVNGLDNLVIASIKASGRVYYSIMKKRELKKLPPI